MTRRIPLALVLVLTLSAAARADTGFLDRIITQNAKTYRYQVYVPVEWSKAQTWPVVVYLHGNGVQGVDGSSHMASGSAAALASALRTDRKRLPAIVIFPQAAPDLNWGVAEMQGMVATQIDAAMKEFNGDTNRLYLWGHSMGGGGALRLAAKWPERFAAMIESSGTATLARNISPERAALDKEANPHLLAADPFGALADRLVNLPIWIFHSSTDQTASVEQSRSVVKALKDRGSQVRYTEYSGLTHTETGATVPTEAEVYAWLVAQRRTEETR